MFDNDNFYNATFTDGENRNVEVIYVHDKMLNTFVVDLHDVDNPDTKRLLEITDVEQIQVNTVLRRRDERKAFEETVKQIAKTEGLLPDDTVEIKGKDQKYITLDKLIFEWDDDDEKQKEALFQLKLKMFDMDHVQKSKKKSAKTNLRKAKTPLETMVVYSKF